MQESASTEQLQDVDLDEFDMRPAPTQQLQDVDADELERRWAKLFPDDNVDANKPSQIQDDMGGVDTTSNVVNDSNTERQEVSNESISTDHDYCRSTNEGT